MVRRMLRELAITERQPPKVRESAQRAQLHRLLTDAMDHVPLYSEQLNAAGFRPDRRPGAER